MRINFPLSNNLFQVHQVQTHSQKSYISSDVAIVHRKLIQHLLDMESQKSRFVYIARRYEKKKHKSQMFSRKTAERHHLTPS